jgi:hypothetical protein
MTWNYRIMTYVMKNHPVKPTRVFVLRSVYYNEEGNPESTLKMKIKINYDNNGS